MSDFTFFPLSFVQLVWRCKTESGVKIYRSFFFLDSYIFAEASGHYGSEYILQSTSVVSIDQTCMRFFFHMNGKDTGLLQVSKLDNNGAYSILWEEIGSQGSQWKEGFIDLPVDVNPYQVCLLRSMFLM